MGRAVAEAALSQGLTVAAGVDVATAALPFPLYPDFASLPAPGPDTVVVDFSHPGTLEGLLTWARAHRVPAVLATTGYSEAQKALIAESAKELPLFASGNFSLGIALLRRLAREAAQVLGEDFDVEIVEAHHRRKVDAPSGTALMLYDAVSSAYSEGREAVYSRADRRQPRPRNEIGIHSVRGGTVTGEHEVCFLGPQERLTLSHSAENRSLFATGALKAASFLLCRAPGLYDMDDLVSTALR
ncbi:MAG: 4-hydroxy-tetrahydrodipicolinate reductase [Clostridia bacterium]|nr:4-hydroxy-tetrahydrodipicolinate reductase [Clostridia bacterium]